MFTKGAAGGLYIIASGRCKEESKDTQPDDRVLIFFRQILIDDAGAMNGDWLANWYNRNGDGGESHP